MSDTRLPASGNIRIFFGPTNSIVNYLAPTNTEINAAGMVDVTDAISWNDFNHLLQASNVVEDPSIAATGKVSDIGSMNYGGSLSFYYPKSFTDATNRFKQVYDLLFSTRTPGYIVVRVDSKHSADTVTLGEQTIAAADIVQVFKVITDGFTESIKGEDAFRYTINFQPQGSAAPRVVVQNNSTAPVTTVVTNDTNTSTMTKTIANGKFKLDAKVDGRYMTNAVTWTSTDVSKATVSKTGVVTPIAAGSVSITATYYGGYGNTIAIGTTVPLALTIS
jgi:hypothetical protein